MAMISSADEYAQNSHDSSPIEMDGGSKQAAFERFSQRDIFENAEALLLCDNATFKATRCQQLYLFWQGLSESEQLTLAPPHETIANPSSTAHRSQNSHAKPASSASQIRQLPAPGRPAKPELVDARDLPRRRLGSIEGRVALIHSLAHIEFNAINLALDAVYRFRDMPLRYIDDWLKVAADEGTHFLLLHDRLASLSTAYGDLPAHDGLWDMARRTDHDVLVRMALVPRILEARGLDVAPPMIEKLNRLNDHESAAILQRIYTDEITHVEIGNRWFRYVCEQRGLDGTAVFCDLLRGENSAYLRSPYNDKARLQAGFNEQELALIKEMEIEYREQN